MRPSRAIALVLLASPLLSHCHGEVLTVGQEAPDGGTEAGTEAGPEAGGCVGAGSCKCGTPRCVGTSWQCDECPAKFPSDTFCTGPTAHAVLNGTEVPTSTLWGKGFALDCCSSAEAVVGVPVLMTDLFVLWRAPAGGSGTIDLAAPPPGFQIELAMACDPSAVDCSRDENFTSGFVGTVDYSTPNASGLTASYCLSVTEPSGSPHPTIHSLQLYVPPLPSPF